MSFVLRSVFVAVLAVLPAFVASAPASAAPLCAWSAEAQKVVCEDSGTGQSGGGANGGGTVYTEPGPYTEYKYVPACSANDATSNSADALCTQATSTCPDGELRFYVYTQTVRPPDYATDEGEWDQAGNQCRGADDPEEGGPVEITAWMIRDEAQANAPATKATSEPQGTSYVHIPNNFYTETDGENVSVDILGVNVQLQYTPTTYSWSFGDGSSGSGAGVEGADVGQAGAVEHEYRRAGRFNATVTRSFEVVATLPNGKSLPMDGLISSTSDAIPMEIDEIQSVVTRVR